MLLHRLVESVLVRDVVAGDFTRSGSTLILDNSRSVDASIDATESDLVLRGDVGGHRGIPDSQPLLVRLLPQLAVLVPVLQTAVLGEDGLILQRLGFTQGRSHVVGVQGERVTLGLGRDEIAEGLCVTLGLGRHTVGVQAVAVALGHVDDEVVLLRVRRSCGVGRSRVVDGLRIAVARHRQGDDEEQCECDRTDEDADARSLSGGAHVDLLMVCRADSPNYSVPGANGL